MLPGRLNAAATALILEKFPCRARPAQQKGQELKTMDNPGGSEGKHHPDDPHPLSPGLITDSCFLWGWIARQRSCLHIPLAGKFGKQILAHRCEDVEDLCHGLRKQTVGSVSGDSNGVSRMESHTF